MSIESLTNSNEALGQKLPIPFIESIEIHTDHLAIQTAIYLKLSADQYPFKGEFLAAMADINCYAQLAIDRNVPDNDIGQALALTYGYGIVYSPFPVNGFSDVANGVSGPINSIYTLELVGFKPDLTISREILDLRVYIDEVVEQLGEEVDRGAHPFTQTGFSYNDFDPSYNDDKNRWDALSADEQTTIATQFVDHLISSFSSNDKAGLWYLDLEGKLRENYSYIGTSGVTENVQDFDDESYHSLGTVSEYIESDEFKQADGSYIIKLSNTTPAAGLPFGAYSTLWNEKTGARKIGLLTYSTTLNLASDMTTIRNSIIAGNTNSALYNSKISEANYKSFIEDDIVMQVPTTVYTDSSGTVYTEVIQSLDGGYYGTSTITLAGIVTSMQSISSTNTSAVFEAHEALDFVLSVHGKNPRLLQELNTYRKTFLDKSSTKPIGRFYDAFKKQLFESNKLVKSGASVKKELLNNPVVKDLRSWSPGTPIATSTRDTTGFKIESDYIWMDSTIWSRSTEVHRVQGSDHDGTFYVAGTAQPYSFALIDTGYFFFNYEKALKTYSYISQVFDVTKFEKLFGAEVTNQSFQMLRCTAKARFKLDPDAPLATGDTIEADDFTTIGIMDLFIDNSTGVPKNEMVAYRNIGKVGETDYDFFQQKTTIDDSVKIHQASLLAGSSGTGETVGEAYGGAFYQDEETEYSYLALRNFKIISTEEGVDPNETQTTFATGKQQYYRIATFEYQKRLALVNTEDSPVDSATVTAAQKQTFFVANVEVEDSTGVLVDALTDRLTTVSTLLDEYAAAAADTCSFNNISGFFNQFFIEAVNSRFPVSSEAPYVIAPVLFHLMVDLLYDTYDGDRDTIYKHAREESTAIGPESGTLTALNSFITRWGLLIVAYTGEINAAAAISSAAAKYTFGTGSSAAVFVPVEDYDNYPTNWAHAEVITTGPDTDTGGDGDPPAIDRDDPFGGDTGPGGAPIGEGPGIPDPYSS